MSRRTLYLDSSALVKLIRDEAETEALEAEIGDDRISTSLVGRIELRRALGRQPKGGNSAARWAYVDERLDVIAVTNATGEQAGTVPPPLLRTLDAIHLATALVLKPELDAFVVYDRRLAEAATALGLPVSSPGAAA